MECTDNFEEKIARKYFMSKNMSSVWIISRPSQLPRYQYSLKKHNCVTCINWEKHLRLGYIDRMGRGNVSRKTKIRLHQVPCFISILVPNKKKLKFWWMIGELRIHNPKFNQLITNKWASCYMIVPAPVATWEFSAYSDRKHMMNESILPQMKTTIKLATTKSNIT